MVICLLYHLCLSVPRTAHTDFSGSCAKIDLWWIRGATGVTHLGCSWISYISASTSLNTLEMRLLRVAGETPLVVFHLLWAGAWWLHRWAICPSLATTFILKNIPESFRCLLFWSTVQGGKFSKYRARRNNLPAAASGVHLCYPCTKPKPAITSGRSCE